MSTEKKGKISRIISVDTGGTFTDFLLFENSQLRTLKIPSPPADPAEAVLQGINSLLTKTTNAYILLHGSTVSTNTVLERTGARVKLITNSGFEDIIEIGSWIGLAVMTKSDITIKNVDWSYLGQIPSVFSRLGIKIIPKGSDMHVPIHPKARRKPQKHGHWLSR